MGRHRGSLALAILLGCSSDGPSGSAPADAGSSTDSGTSDGGGPPGDAATDGGGSGGGYRDIADAAAWSKFDLTTLGGDFGFGVTYYGGGFDGRYVYLAPGGYSVALRFDARSPAAMPPSYKGSFL